MRRLPILLLAAVTLVHGQTPEAVTKLLAQAAGALSGNNLAAFVKTLDPSMPGYAKLTNEVTVLLAQAEVISSIEIRGDKGDDNTRDLDLDWYLEINSQTPEGPSARRRQIVHCRVARRAKRWKIVALDPVAFFSPLNP
ncbi:MAG: hypothetical protein ABI165_19435 [Bryobacteraceae bacterium]